MTSYLVLARTTRSRKYDRFYTIVQSDRHTAARAVWSAYKQQVGEFDEPEQCEIVVVELSMSARAQSLGNFETGWIDAPHETFSGTDL